MAPFDPRKLKARRVGLCQAVVSGDTQELRDESKPGRKRLMLG
jgi:hypothetical protein